MTTSQSTPTVYVIAGPNGAGKTTFATDFLPTYVDCLQFLNADLIAAGFRLSRPRRRTCGRGGCFWNGSGNAWRLFDASRIPPALIASESNGLRVVEQPGLFA